ncbi:HNH endonuclease, partial [bacterium]|nr:HNH endonuclease [bacterium]
CQICYNTIKNFKIDHIRPLANGETNDINNLQVLCTVCHREKTETEKETGKYIKLVDSESSFNNKVKNIIESELSKSYAFIEIQKSVTTKKNIVTFDINKCRTNILYQGKYNYPVFSVMDNVVDYNGQTEAGLYFIESKNMFPLRGNGWYYYPMVAYCLENNIITSNDIKYCVISSLNIDSTYYNKFIDYCRNNFDVKTCKFAINSMIGCFARNTSKNQISSILTVTNDSQEAFEYYYKYDGDFVEIQNINDDNYFIVYKYNSSMKMETESPIYNQIVQMEAIELHKLKNLVIQNGGEILDLNTDAITCGFDGDVNNILNVKYPDGSLMYKTEVKKRLEVQKMAKLTRTETYSNFNHKYKIFQDVEDNNFNPLVDMIINNNQSIHI